MAFSTPEMSNRMRFVSSPHEVEEKAGDLFQAPGGSALMHACSARGAWGKGIALQFQIKYPGAYERYKSHCMRARIANKKHDIPNRHGKSPCKVSVTLPVGTALVIPPWEANSNKNHWIICLFTSYNYGIRTDSRTAILNNTAAALDDLKRTLEAYRRMEHATGSYISHIYTCRLNSGLFDVPWEMTKPLLERAALPQRVSVIYQPDPERNPQKEIGRGRRLGSSSDP